MKTVLFELCFISLALFLATTVCAQTESGMISCWSFDEGDGNFAMDSINCNDGIVYGASWVPGIAGTALSFDGVDDYVFVDHDNSLITTEMSFELWVNPRQASSFLLDKYYFSTGFFVREVSKKWIFYLDGWSVYSDSDIEIGVWTHLAGTYDGSSLKIYVNGVNEATKYPGDQLVNDNSLPLEFGTSGASHFDGVIDEIALYERALTSEEIEQHFQDGLQGLGCCGGEIEIIDIDIKPKTDRNNINLRRMRKKGVIPVAILTTEYFDATGVDPLSVVFGPNGAFAVHGKGGIKDVDSDGDADLMLFFYTRDTGIACNDEKVVLTGETFDGRKVKGCDYVQVTKCYKQSRHP